MKGVEHRQLLIDQAVVRIVTFLLLSRGGKAAPCQTGLGSARLLAELLHKGGRIKVILEP